MFLHWIHSTAGRELIATLPTDVAIDNVSAESVPVSAFWAKQKQCSDSFAADEKNLA